jgi:hypothetical protein
LALWVVLALLAWLNAGRPVLRFLFWYLVVVPLPIEFLIGRTQACLVLIMVGAVAFAVVVLADTIEAIARLLSKALRLPPVSRRLLAGAMVAAAVFFWVREQRSLRLDIGKAPMTTLGFETWDLIQQLRASAFHPRPGSFVAFLDDPFHSGDMYNLAQLWVHDRSVTVHAWSQGALTPEELAKTDYIFTFENRKLIRVK